MINATRKVKKAEPGIAGGVKEGADGAARLLPGWPIYPSISKRPLPHRLNQKSRERGHQRENPEERGCALCQRRKRRTRALPFARLGKKRLPCVAYGKRPTTERGNGLWRQGGFKWSSQHLDGSCDEHSKTALRSFWAGALVLTRSTAGGRARGAAAILGSDCGGHGE